MVIMSPMPDCSFFGSYFFHLKFDPEIYPKPKPKSSILHALLLKMVSLNQPLFSLTVAVPILPGQGCQIFLRTTYQNWEKITKLPQNVLNGHETYQMVTK
jgi:hypothetical protein